MEVTRKCPFCGHIELLIPVYAGWGRYAVTCPDCHAQGPPRSTEGAAIKAWNETKEAASGA